MGVKFKNKQISVLLYLKHRCHGEEKKKLGKTDHKCIFQHE